MEGTPGECDCSDPIRPGECTADDSQAACICDDGQIGLQTCEGGEGGGPGECDCPDPIPESQCRSDLDCTDGLFCYGVERCEPGSDGADVGGCVDAAAQPDCDDGVACTIDRCSDELNRCTSAAPDADADGHADGACEDGQGQPLGDDCDDGDPDRFPGNPEVCSEGDFDHDEDCNPDTFGVLDVDADGATDSRCCNGDTCGGDCDDLSIARRIGQPEFCDNRDNDCDGETDEETGAVPWYVDADGDGFGGVDGMDDALTQCIPVPGRSLLPTDCNDADPGKHPAQLERCDLRDNNCNLLADERAQCPYEAFAVAPDDAGGVDVPGGGGPLCPPFGYQDADGDGFGDTATALSLDPDAADCDLVDNDCDGIVDREPEASEACMLPHIAASCELGQCVAATGAACEAPHADCDGLEASGCETDVRSSPSHCGGCDQVCGLGDLCVDSVCAASPYLQVVAGQYYTLVRRAGGLLGWGRSTAGQLGTDGDVLAPIRVGAVTGVTQVAAGEAHVCQRRGGSVQCWGTNGYGQVGNGVSNGTKVLSPTTVVGIDDAVHVAAGADHSCVIRADRSVWCWGRANSGQLGYSASPANTVTAPVQVSGIDDAIDLGLGAGANLNRMLPEKVPGLTTATRLATSAGPNAYMCAILEGGAVTCWGQNTGGQLGNQGNADTWTPGAFVGVANAKAVSVGFGHTCVVETDGDLWCAGYGDVAQIGQPEAEGNSATARQVDLGGVGASMVACGHRHTCAVLQDGRVVCFGGNQYGQVGAGATTGSSVGVHPYRTPLAAP